MQRDPNKAVSARGEMVDFELLRVKQEIANNTVVTKREPRRGRRRRLSERVTKAVRREGVDVKVAQPETTTEAPSRIVRKAAKKKEQP